MGILGCGNNFAYIYFISFTIFIYLMIMNLFIAVVIEGFNMAVSAYIILNIWHRAKRTLAL
jgi:hypothetical protein